MANEFYSGMKGPLAIAKLNELWALNGGVAGTLVYKGNWDASSTVYPLTPSTGHYYRVSVTGVTNTITYTVNDAIVYNGSTWDKIDNTAGGASTTDLGVGTRTDTTIIITSSTGADVTVPQATTTQAGAMSGTDKNKLNGLSNYTLPMAAAGTLGGVKVGSGLAIDGGGVLSSTGSGTTNLGIGTVTTTTVPLTSSSGTGASIPAATISTAGVLSSTDKTKLDGLTNYTLPTAAAGTLGGVKVGTGLAIDGLGVLSATGGAGGTDLAISTRTDTTLLVTSSTGLDATLPQASTTEAGLMSGTDKNKLNGIANSANNYSLPTAAAGTLGGIKVGSGLAIDGGGVLTTTGSGTTDLAISTRTDTTLLVTSSTGVDATIPQATTTEAGLLSGTDKTKLNSLSNYTHPTGDGNLHVPATSTTNSGKVLTAGATAGTFTWEAPGGVSNPTTYTSTVQIATASQTIFNITYTVGYIDVYINGSRLTTSDFTASNGTSVTLAVGATADDEVMFVVFSILSMGYWLEPTDIGVTVGYLNVPQNSKSVAYTCIASDAGKHILHPSADTTARIFTIPTNATVPYEIGTTITFVNQNAAGVITISIATADVMRLAGFGTTGDRTLAANGIATALKITSTEWIISGTGLT